MYTNTNVCNNNIILNVKEIILLHFIKYNNTLILNCNIYFEYKQHISNKIMINYNNIILHIYYVNTIVLNSKNVNPLVVARRLWMISTFLTKISIMDIDPIIISTSLEALIGKLK